MMMTFYPGPSKIYPQVRQYLLDAHDSGILSVNHRSEAFMEMCHKTLQLLHEKLNIPADYTVVFVSSATECWEIIAQSFTRNAGFHLYNGSFGEKWFDYARRIQPNAAAASQTINESLVTLSRQLPPPNEMLLATADVICLTQNETSNGTQLPGTHIRQFREFFSDALIAVDATSSLGGADLPIENADIWFGSVQKCLGLPAGLALLIASPKAVETAEKIADRRFYNSFLFMRDNIQTFQTHYTPNVLNIYLLMRVLESVENVHIIAEQLKREAADWYSFLEAHPVLKPLINNAPVRSDTVIAVAADEKIVSSVKQKAQAANIELGNGYGRWKANTFRIANFPAIDMREISALKQVLLNI